ncbi:HipA domain-containing protein [Orenia marismortui]|uniref:HipA domain-containing protein n=1 Tax=Orenia marismortui TaxID=46469 RepID=UPI000377A2B0|nr:HipA domain-containing protein [Orenia marismortui]
MEESSYDIINLNKEKKWQKTGEAFTGKSDSYWIQNVVNRQKAILKIPKEQERENSIGYSGEHLAEKLASEIGLKLGLNMPEIDLAIYDNIECCISYSFCQAGGVELKEGREILIQDITENENRDKYTVENIVSHLHEYGLVEEFVEMMLFDALVGQQDRHEENWGILNCPGDPVNRYQFAPIYDNSSCLTREVHRYKHGINIKLYNSEHFKSYLRRSKSLIRIESNNTHTISHFDMVEYLYDKYPELCISFNDKLKGITKKEIEDIISKIPSGFILNNHRKVILKVFCARKEKIMNIIE